MWDTTVPNISLAMIHPSLQSAPKPALPAPYKVRPYREGDEHHWARIEMEAGEFTRHAQGLEAFHRDFEPGREHLPRRMLFLTDAYGIPVGTASGWYREGKGLLHWVAIHPAHQGRGLSAPLVSLAMEKMVELGHTDGLLHTQTPSWVAVKVYLSLGWQPFDEGHKDFKRGWQVVAQKLGRAHIK